MASDPENSGIIKNIFTGYLILILHVVLLVVLGFFIIFFRGLVQYMPWILGGGLVLVASILLWLYIRYRRHRNNSIQHVRSPGRGVEISLLGGLASMRVGGSPQADGWSGSEPLQLEEPQVSRMRSLERLMDMYNHDLISRAEFLCLKGDLLVAEVEQGDALIEGAETERSEEATIVEDDEKFRD